MRGTRLLCRVQGDAQAGLGSQTGAHVWTPPSLLPQSRRSPRAGPRMSGLEEAKLKPPPPVPARSECPVTEGRKDPGLGLAPDTGLGPLQSCPEVSSPLRHSLWVPRLKALPAGGPWRRREMLGASHACPPAAHAEQGPGRPLPPAHQPTPIMAPLPPRLTVPALADKATHVPGRVSGTELPPGGLSSAGGRELFVVPQKLVGGSPRGRCCEAARPGRCLSPRAPPVTRSPWNITPAGDSLPPSAPHPVAAWTLHEAGTGPHGG